MAENGLGSPIFADRYKFQTVGDDWDRGRSGFTHLVFDTKTERLGVIKRAELKSRQAVEGLKNEIAALLDLKGHSVPEVYDTGETEYGSKYYFYAVIEYIEGIRVEKGLDSLTASERADILTQFFSLLAKAHKMGIVNGDVDLKHLFWRKDKKQLVVIDWGNARLDVNTKNKTEFAYDLARAAEIIYSLVTVEGHPAATGSIALPNNSALIPSVAPLPPEFHELCRWAPRTPSEGSQAPFTAQELFESSKKWHKSVEKLKPYKPSRRPNWILRTLSLAALIALGYWIVTSPVSPLYPILHPPVPTLHVVASDTSAPTLTNTPQSIATSSATVETATTAASSETPTITPSLEPTPTFIDTPVPAISPVPATYTNPIMVFNRDSVIPDECWFNDPKPGFGRRDDGNWRFNIERGTPIDQFLQTDFSKCLDLGQVKAVGLNAWIPRLELEREQPEKESGKEFGFFLQNAAGQRREYTIWVDIKGSMHLQIRENGEVTLNEIILIVNEGNLKIKGVFPRLYAEFPIKIFFEINNNGLDIIYLQQGLVQQAAKIEELDPNQMLPIINSAVRPTLGDIQSIGLIGYGGETQTVIWPLVFFGE